MISSSFQTPFNTNQKRRAGILALTESILEKRKRVLNRETMEGGGKGGSGPPGLPPG